MNQYRRMLAAHLVSVFSVVMVTASARLYCLNTATDANRLAIADETAKPMRSALGPCSGSVKGRAISCPRKASEAWSDAVVTTADYGEIPIALSMSLLRRAGLQVYVLRLCDLTQ